MILEIYLVFFVYKILFQEIRSITTFLGYVKVAHVHLEGTNTLATLLHNWQKKTFPTYS